MKINKTYVFPNEMRTNEIQNEIGKIKKWRKKVKTKHLQYRKNIHL